MSVQSAPRDDAHAGHARVDPEGAVCIERLRVTAADLGAEAREDLREALRVRRLHERAVHIGVGDGLHPARRLGARRRPFHQRLHDRACRCLRGFVDRQQRTDNDDPRLAEGIEGAGIGCRIASIVQCAPTQFVDGVVVFLAGPRRRSRIELPIGQPDQNLAAGLCRLLIRKLVLGPRESGGPVRIAARLGVFDRAAQLVRAALGPRAERDGRREAGAEETGTPIDGSLAAELAELIKAVRKDGGTKFVGVSSGIAVAGSERSRVVDQVIDVEDIARREARAEVGNRGRTVLTEEFVAPIDRCHHSGEGGGPADGRRAGERRGQTDDEECGECRDRRSEHLHDRPSASDSGTLRFRMCHAPTAMPIPTVHSNARRYAGFVT